MSPVRWMQGVDGDNELVWQVMCSGTMSWPAFGTFPRLRVHQIIQIQIDSWWEA